jgi:hypothetical protein
VIREVWKEMREHPWRTAAEAATLAVVLVVMLAAFLAATLVGWGALQ